MSGYRTYPALVERWIDGDTVDLIVDLGFHLACADRFRLVVVDTPERGQPGWAEATARCNQLAPVGTAVRIYTFKPYQDKYGRYLADVLVGDISVGQILLQEGLAVPYEQ